MHCELCVSVLFIFGAMFLFDGVVGVLLYSCSRERDHNQIMRMIVSRCIQKRAHILSAIVEKKEKHFIGLTIAENLERFFFFSFSLFVCELLITNPSTCPAAQFNMGLETCSVNNSSTRAR